MTTTPTSGAADLPEALRAPLDSLHADAGYLCGRLLNGSLTQEQVVDSIRRRIDAAKLAAITELESQLAQRFDAADMATAAAQGFRDGVASVAASAGEPAAYLIDWPDEPELGHYFSESPTETGRCRPRYLAAPPTAPAVAAPDPVAYLYDDGSWTPAKTEEGRKLSNWMISAGSPKIGVLLASAAQPTRAVQATQTGNQREARPCHVFTVRKAGSLTEWAPTSMAFALPDGAHALYTLPAPPTSAEGVEHAD